MGVILQDELRHAQTQIQQSEHDKQLSAQDLRQVLEKCAESEKENQMSQRYRQEQRNVIGSLENKLRLAQDVAKIMTPGDHIKMMRASENESLAHEHSLL